MLPNIVMILQFLLLIAAILLQPVWISWFTLQLSTVLPFFLAAIDREGKVSRQLFLPGLLSSSFLAAGFWLGLPSSDSSIHQVGIIFLCVGVGGLIGWFPATTKTNFPAHSHSQMSLITHQLLSVCIGSIFFYRCVHAFSWTEEDLALLAVVSLCSLMICGTRLMGSLSIHQRIQLSTLTVLSNSNIATILSGWEKMNASRVWKSTSNLPTGSELFIAILIIEVFAVVLLILVLHKVTNSQPDRLTDEEFMKKLNRQKWVRKPFLFASLSLAGFPFFPGSLWRFTLLAALLLPHQQSNVNQLSEPHHAFISLALIFMLVALPSSLGHSKMLLLSLRFHDEDSCRPHDAQDFSREAS